MGEPGAEPGAEPGDAERTLVLGLLLCVVGSEVVVAAVAAVAVGLNAFLKLSGVKCPCVTYVTSYYFFSAFFTAL